MTKSLPSRYVPVILLFLPAVLLFLPVLYYSLNTPFSLIDDYGIAMSPMHYLDSLEWFLGWLNRDILTLPGQRWHPFWELYNSLTWKILGPTAWLHHLFRWMVHFASVLLFVAAFLRIAPIHTGRHPSSLFVHLLPVACLVYVWMFFPNQPAARLGTQEVLSVFFLSMLTFLIAFMLQPASTDRNIHSPALVYALFYLAYIGLTFSKENNLGAALWILVFYYAISCRGRDVQLSNRMFQKRLLGGIPLILIFTYSLIMVYAASSVEYTVYDLYNASPLDGWHIVRNLRWVTGSIFLTNTSPIIAVTTALMSAFLLRVIARKISMRQLSHEVLFVLFLIGLFVSQCFILTTSPLRVLRYWYILIPVFSALLAFSVRFIMNPPPPIGNNSLEDHPGILSKSRQILAMRPTAIVVFIMFFAGSNYYNFLAQTVVQYHRATIESDLLSEVTRLLDSGERVFYQNRGYEPADRIGTYHAEYLPYYHGKQRRDVPPYHAGLGRKPYYLVSLKSTAPPRSDLNIHFTVPSARPSSPIFLGEYRLMKYAYEVSDALQIGVPNYRADHGAPPDDWVIYHWNGSEN